MTAQVAVTVLTFDRPHFLRRCIQSLASDTIYHLIVVDNGSTDEETKRLVAAVAAEDRKSMQIDTEAMARGGMDLIRELEAQTAGQRDMRCMAVRTGDANRSIGAAKNIGIRMAVQTGADLIVSSDDDYEYRPGWLRKAVAFFAEAPADVGILCALLEPDYPWNTARGVVEAGGLRTLVRDTVPGGGWIFRREMADTILPLPDQSGGEDVAVCERLRKAGYRLCAADLATHPGEKSSLIQNMAWRMARPLDRVKWGV